MMVVQDGGSMMQVAQLHQMMSELAAAQHAALQMDQAAKAHAAEAARLQAGVRQLQAAHSVPDGQPPNMWDPTIRSPAQQVTYDALEMYYAHKPEAVMAQQFTPGPTPAGGDGPRLQVKNTFIEVRDTTGSRPLRPIASAAGRLDALAPEDTPPAVIRQPSGPFATALGASPTSAGVGTNSASSGVADPMGASKLQNSNEPVQIPLGSLRSLSSNSVAAMGGGEADDDEAPFSQLATAASTAASGSKSQTSRQISSMEPMNIQPGRLRSIRSAGGRLDMLAEEDADFLTRQTSGRPSGDPGLQHRVLLPRADGLSKVPEAVGTSWSQSRHDSGSDFSPEAGALQAMQGQLATYLSRTTPLPQATTAYCGPSFVNADGGGTQAWGSQLGEPWAAGYPPQSAMKVVRTAAGRLDLMGGGSEEDESA